jgi:hypothetical protein
MCTGGGCHAGTTTASSPLIVTSGLRPVASWRDSATRLSSQPARTSSAQTATASADDLGAGDFMEATRCRSGIPSGRATRQ